MSTTFFSHVLDDPVYIGNNEYISVVTDGKLNLADTHIRDMNKDAAVKAGLLRINAKTKKSTFINFHRLSEKGDRYRGAVCINDHVYVMRTQKKHVDSVVRIAKINLKTNEVVMIEERAITVHGKATPKTFCGHFNFGRPLVIDNKIIYPPLNSGVVIVYDTITNVFVAHDVPEDYSSIWSTYLPDSEEVVFFPYGNLTDNLLILNLRTNEQKFAKSPNPGTFYSTFTYKNVAVGVPLLMNPSDKMYFWLYSDDKISNIEYRPRNIQTYSMIGFKYGILNSGNYYAHTCWDKGQELVKVNLDKHSIEIIKTDLSLGARPVYVDGSMYLFPSIQNKEMLNAPNSVYRMVNGIPMKEFELPTNNISYAPINDSAQDLILVPYKFDYNIESRKLQAPISVINLKDKCAEILNLELDLE